MVVIQGLKHSEASLLAKFYIADPRSLSYALSGGEGTTLPIKVVVYVLGNYVGYKDYACQNTAETTSVKAKFDKFNAALMTWTPASGVSFLEMP